MDWIDTKGASEYMKVSTRTISREMKAGKLKFAKPGHRVLFRKYWLDCWILGKDPDKLSYADKQELAQL